MILGGDTPSRNIFSAYFKLNGRKSCEILLLWNNFKNQPYIDNTYELFEIFENSL